MKIRSKACMHYMTLHYQLIDLSDYIDLCIKHWGKADDLNCNYGHPKKADMKLGKNLFCPLNCFYNVF
jgi:hypothetical protein